MIKKSNEQMEVLDIVDKAVVEWRKAMKTLNNGGGLHGTVLEIINRKITDLQAKLEKMIITPKERNALIERALLATLKDSDYNESLPNLVRLLQLADKQPSPQNFTDFINNVKEKKGMKISSAPIDSCEKALNKRRLKGPIVERVNIYQMPFMARSSRNYGEYCTDFIEQNALELYLLGRLDDDMGEGTAELKDRIEARNPHTKIFAQGIVKLASKQINNFNDEEIINTTVRDKINLLREQQDYGIPKKKPKQNKSKK